VVQVKKKQIREAILDSAFDLFSERGYHRTTLQEIADLSGIGVSSVYSYFPSKLHLLYAVLEPWQAEVMERLERRVRALKTPRARLRATLLGIWRDIPLENIGLANSLMEALASADPAQKKPMPLLTWTEEQLMRILSLSLARGGAHRIDYAMLPHLFMMAYDGFVINRRLNDVRDIERLTEMMCDILLSPGEAQ
jgi:AcrR family transcriptional regulator